MKQITEDYVSFETAQLLKEKGFDEYCLKNYWSSDKELHDWKWELSYNRNSDGNRNTRDCAAPTQSLALKWLREVHKLFIEIVWTGYENMYSFNVTNMKDGFIKEANIACSYEEAVEAALKYTLENLI